MMEKVLPWIMAALSLLASAVYTWHGDYRHGLYWFFATCLTVTVTY